MKITIEVYGQNEPLIIYAPEDIPIDTAISIFCNPNGFLVLRGERHFIESAKFSSDTKPKSEISFVENQTKILNKG